MAQINWKAAPPHGWKMTKDWVQENPIVIGDVSTSGDHFFLVRFVNEKELYGLGRELAKICRMELSGMTIYSFPKEDNGTVQGGFLPGKAFVFLHLRQH